MVRFILQRAIQIVPTLIGASIFVFALLFLTGDPVLLLLPPDTPPHQVSALREELGFNAPIAAQYVQFLGGALTGDLGDSFRFREPALQLVIQRLPATLELTVYSILLAGLIGIPMGVVAAVRANSAVDRAIRMMFFMFQGIPPFFLGLVLMVVFSVQLNLLPSAGRGGIAHLVMPVVTISLFLVASIARLTRNGMVRELQSDYIRTAHAKGLSEKVVLYKHATRNTLIPVVTMLGLQFGHLIGGAVVTETIFAWPGVGRLVVDAVYNRDFPIVQAAMLVIVAIFVLVNLVVDISYGLLDPRIRYN